MEPAFPIQTICYTASTAINQNPMRQYNTIHLHSFALKWNIFPNYYLFWMAIR